MSNLLILTIIYVMDFSLIFENPIFTDNVPF